MTITITEALAEIKTIGKRIEKKRESVAGYVARQDGVRDPLEKSGGSLLFIQQEEQAIADLETRLIALRRGIQQANDATIVTIGGVGRSVSEWLTWRRDVAPGRRAWFQKINSVLVQLRSKAQQQGASMISATAVAGAEPKPHDFIVNVDEAALARESEQLEETLGTLDGQLSLKNATVMVDVD